MSQAKKRVSAKKVSVTRVTGEKAGRAVWRLSDGRFLKSSVSSTAVMDDAVRVYSAALKRLAKR
jgi:hypothetical protein